MAFRFENAELDTSTYELRVDGERVSVEPQVFDVLAYLIEHRDRVVPRTEILDAVWGDRFVSDSALSSRIAAARSALGDDGRTQRVIRTVHGRGVQFVASVEVTNDRPALGGTVSLLFTDVEDSTLHWDNHPETMSAALEHRDTILREVVDALDGSVFSTAGDAFAAAFPTPEAAIEAARRGQRACQAEPWPDEVPIKVRMAVHAGTAQERDGAYFGAAVNRVEGLAALARGGQVLVSSTVEEMVRDHLADDVGLRDYGQHTLKGSPRPETAFQLTAPDLPDEFPTFTAATSAPGNLPTPPTSFLGREEEIKRLATEIPAHRLVSLVGPGGVGKTRLSIEAAGALADDFTDGIWFVELAPVTDTDAVIDAVASTLSVQPEAGASLTESIVDSLNGRHMLVVLDNCEHVIGAAADLAAAIIADASTTTILATTREPLGVAGEKVLDVVPLETGIDAVELFLERARSVVDGFTASDADVELIRSICVRLDGMPLAIELAASRVRSISLAQLAVRLEDRFRLLRSTARGGAVERHQTLQATVEWSYRLLTDDEQLLFDRLSIFAGGFDLEAAEAICGFEPIDEFDVFDLVSSLVDKSLVSVDRYAGRYRLLDTLRQYGAERLRARAETEVLQARYVDHYLEVARQAREQFEGTHNHAGRELFELEWDNLRAAVDHAESTGAGDEANALLRHCWWYSLSAGRNEHGRWTQRRLSSAGADPFSFAIGGWWAYFAGDFAEADELGRRSIELADSPEDPECAMGWFDRTTAAWYEGRTEDALATFRHARAGADPDDAFNLLIRTWPHPFVALAPDEAPALLAEAHAVADPLGNDTLDAYVAWFEYNFAFGSGDNETALAALRRAADLGRRSRCHIVEGVALSLLAARSHILADDDPTEQFRAALWRLSEARYWGALSFALSGLANWWTTIGQLEGAARVIGYLDSHDPGGNQIVVDLRTSAKQTLDGSPDAPTWLAEGAAMPRDELVAYCLERLGS